MSVQTFSNKHIWTNTFHYNWLSWFCFNIQTHNPTVMLNSNHHICLLDLKSSKSSKSVLKTEKHGSLWQLLLLMDDYALKLLLTSARLLAVAHGVCISEFTQMENEVVLKAAHQNALSTYERETLGPSEYLKEIKFRSAFCALCRSAFMHLNYLAV